MTFRNPLQRLYSQSCHRSQSLLLSILERRRSTFCRTMGLELAKRLCMPIFISFPGTGVTTTLDLCGDRDLFPVEVNLGHLLTLFDCVWKSTAAIGFRFIKAMKRQRSTHYRLAHILDTYKRLLSLLTCQYTNNAPIVPVDTLLEPQTLDPQHLQAV